MNLRAGAGSRIPITVCEGGGGGEGADMALTQPAKGHWSQRDSAGVPRLRDRVVYRLEIALVLMTGVQNATLSHLFTRLFIYLSPPPPPSLQRDYI